MVMWVVSPALPYGTEEVLGIEPTHPLLQQVGVCSSASRWGGFVGSGSHVTLPPTATLGAAGRISIRATALRIRGGGEGRATVVSTHTAATDLLLNTAPTAARRDVVAVQALELSTYEGLLRLTT